MSWIAMLVILILAKTMQICNGESVSRIQEWKKTEQLKLDFIESRHKYLQTEDTDVMVLTQKFRSDLNGFLLSHVDNLREIKDVSEALYQAYEYDSTLRNFQYANDKDGNPDQIEVTYSKEIKVNLNYSFVQVPTEIYRNDIKVLNEAKWSQNLNALFRSNFKRNPTLQWQYIGKESGVMRTFPGSK